MRPGDAQLALARAALDPQAALNAAPMALADSVRAEVVAGVPAPERLRGLTLEVTVEPPAPYSRWRFFIFWVLLKLAARVYRFEFRVHRTREPWEE